MRLPLVIALGLLGACQTTGPVGEAAPALHRGAIAAAAGTEALFEGTNRDSRAADSERVLLRAEAPGVALPALEEADFTPLVEPATVAQWRALFAAIIGYTASLAKLTDPVLAAGVGAELEAVGQQFGRLAGAPTARVGKVSGLVGAVGEAIVAARAERQAADVARRTDPALNALLLGMADALGADDRSGLRGTVVDQWRAGNLAALQTRFGALPRDKAASPERRQLVAKFVDGLDRRDAALAGLADLRGALLALAEAHRASARADPGGARAWVDRLERTADDIGRRMER